MMLDYDDALICSSLLPFYISNIALSYISHYNDIQKLVNYVKNLGIMVHIQHEDMFTFHVNHVR